MKKEKINKILLIISFLPYVLLILISLYHSVFGYDVYTLILPTYVKTIYGMEAFLSTLSWNALLLCFIPILPICLLYQIINLTIYIINKIKHKKFKHIIIYLFAICAVLLICVLLFSRL